MNNFQVKNLLLAHGIRNLNTCVASHDCDIDFEQCHTFNIDMGITAYYDAKAVWMWLGY